MMNVVNHQNLLRQTKLESLPNELLLTIFSYLSPLEIFHSFLHLNARLNCTISCYRENIFLSQLSRSEFGDLINIYLIQLAQNVRSLTINSQSTDGMGEDFERKFHKIDQQLPHLEKLNLQQIEIETLENLSWRFNTMTNLRELNIDIADDRLAMKPLEFNNFLCGKLFSSSNTFQKLTVNYNDGGFRLSPLTHSCKYLRSLSICIRSVTDLFVLFDALPSIENLQVHIDCSGPHDENNIEYSYEKLWWKVPVLEKFRLSIRGKRINFHEQMVKSEILFSIVENLYALREMKFFADIEFTPTLRDSTTKDVFLKTYFPFVDGSLWEKSFQRNDCRKIYFEFHIEVDGSKFSSTRMSLLDPSSSSVRCNDDLTISKQIMTTFQTIYWLEKDLHVEYSSSNEYQFSVYSIPIRQETFETVSSTIHQQISTTPSAKYFHVKNLHIHSTATQISSSGIMLTDLLRHYPQLITLNISEKLLLPPPTSSICSTRLRCLTLHNNTLNDFSELLTFFPRVTTVAFKLVSFQNFVSGPIKKNFCTITRLKLSSSTFNHDVFMRVIASFPNLTEFYLSICDTTFLAREKFNPYELLPQISLELSKRRYIEINLHTTIDREVAKRWELKRYPMLTKYTQMYDGRIFRLKQWF